MKRIVIIMGFVGLLLPNILFADRFNLQDKVVYDNKTKLIWQSSPTTKKYEWSDGIFSIGAKQYCKNLNYGGYSDWRLPNLYELKSLVDYQKYNPAIATNLINIKTDDYYWSSSYDVDNSSGAWGVYFKDGLDFWSGKSDSNYGVLCVRGGGQ